MEAEFFNFTFNSKIFPRKSNFCSYFYFISNSLLILIIVTQRHSHIFISAFNTPLVLNSDECILF